MTPVQQKVRELFDTYCRQHPNTVWQLQTPEDRIGIERAMTNWICNTFRLVHVPAVESWNQKHAEVKAAIVEIVQGVVAGT